MTTNHGKIRREDVALTSTPSMEGRRVTLLHVPTRTKVEASDRTELLAEQAAWIKLRDELEGLNGA